VVASKVEFQESKPALPATNNHYRHIHIWY
jgi:hypothetical protein